MQRLGFMLALMGLTACGAASEDASLSMDSASSVSGTTGTTSSTTNSTATARPSWRRLEGELAIVDEELVLEGSELYLTFLGDDLATSFCPARLRITEATVDLRDDELFYGWQLSVVEVRGAQSTGPTDTTTSPTSPTSPTSSTSTGTSTGTTGTSSPTGTLDSGHSDTGVITDTGTVPPPSTFVVTGRPPGCENLVVPSTLWIGLGPTDERMEPQIVENGWSSLSLIGFYLQESGGPLLSIGVADSANQEFGGEGPRLEAPLSDGLYEFRSVFLMGL